MADKQRQIIAIGGGGFYRDSENLALEKYVIQQTGVESPRVAFVPTASGEPDHYLSSFYAAFLKLGCRPSVLTFFKRTPELRSFLLNQDVIYVGGGNTKTLLAVWRDWGVTEILREAWESGVVLTGVSAGAICWFEQGLTDSFSDELRPLDCLGFLPGSCCPHYDGEAQRRPSYHKLLASGEINAGVAIEDWTGVHFIGKELHRVIASKRGARAYSMRAVYGSVQEVPLPVEYLG
ncbi:MAG: peptidase E [Deltaproteobacteria bacterium]|nr:peptidase E [Deltaproteobacteria bacterium]MDZ4346795.1 peptidase E [Candidatus Binatia bacterium]